MAEFSLINAKCMNTVLK